MTTLEQIQASIQAQVQRVSNVKFLEALHILLDQHLAQQSPNTPISPPLDDTGDLEQRVADELKDGEIESWLKDI